MSYRLNTAVASAAALLLLSGCGETSNLGEDSASGTPTVIGGTPTTHAPDAQPPARGDQATQGPAESAPGVGEIRDRFAIRDQTFVLRKGNAKFGEEHIRQGGTHQMKESHLLTGQAKSLWVKAFNEGRRSQNGSKGYYATEYLSNEEKRTMCVVVGTSDYVDNSGERHGPVGIVTAYWFKGHGLLAKCG